MRNTRSVNAKTALRREERVERVRAGKPSPRLDYRCPICKGWFSRYRNRHASGNVTDAYFHAYVVLCDLVLIICHYIIQVKNLYNFVGPFGGGPEQIRSNKVE